MNSKLAHTLPMGLRQSIRNTNAPVDSEMYEGTGATEKHMSY